MARDPLLESSNNSSCSYKCVSARVLEHLYTVGKKMSKDYVIADTENEVLQEGITFAKACETLEEDNIQEETLQEHEIEERPVQGTHHTCGPFRVYGNLIMKPLKTQYFHQVEILQARDTFQDESVQHEALQDQLFHEKILENGKNETLEEDENRDKELEIFERGTGEIEDELFECETPEGKMQYFIVQNDSVPEIRMKRLMREEQTANNTIGELEVLKVSETLEKDTLLTGSYMIEEGDGIVKDEPGYLQSEFLDEDTLREDDENPETLVKVESESEVLELCPTCLSVGREMRPIDEDASRVYGMLLAGFYEEDQIDEFVSYSRVCWECLYEVRRVLRLQRRVLDANCRLQECQLDGGEEKPPSLSRLSTTTRRGFDSVFMYELSEPQAAPRRRGRPRKHPLPETPPTPPRKKQKRKKRKQTRCTTGAVSRRRRDAKFVKVRIDDGELQSLREKQRARPEYASAAHRCHTCIKGFTFVSLLEKHMRTKHGEEAGAHECSVCSLRFEDEMTMQRHNRRHYALYSCGECGFTYPLLAQVERHYNAAHDPGRSYACDKCGLVFLKEREMRYHKEKTHKPSYQCHYCDKIFNNGQVFRGHLRIHTGMPTLECSICRKKCRGDSGLYAHMRTAHNSEKSEEAYCAECRIQFRNKDGYKFHLRHSVKHSTPEQLKYQCEKCSKRFLSMTALRQHHAYYHLEYKCKICNKRLNSRFTYSKHMKFIHEGYVMPKKHVCEVCGKAFKTKHQLKTHNLTHTGQRPHACDVCGATFAQKSTLRTHRQLIHLKCGRGGAMSAA